MGRFDHNFDRRNLTTMVVRIFRKPEMKDYGTVLTSSRIGTDRKMPDGSWRKRKDLRLIIRSGTDEAAAELLKLEQWDYVRASGYLGTWITLSQFGESAEPCFTARVVEKLNIEEARKILAESKFPLDSTSLHRV